MDLGGFFRQKRIVVTGGAGFLGGAVCEELARYVPAMVFVPRSQQYDLRDPGAIRRLLADTNTDVILHLAAKVGGIGANMEHPGQFFYDNAVMGIHLMEEARKFGVEKFVNIGTICAYPKFAPVPFREEGLWDGYPEETNAPYGLAKKMLLVQAAAYRQEYGFNVISLLPVNLYGPRDNFDDATSHVIPAIIKKITAAKYCGDTSIQLWGTGEVSREFLHVSDAARAIIQATALYNESAPVNVGSGHEITIRDLAHDLCRLSGFDGQIEWDATKPNGQPRRCLDTTKAWEAFRFRARVSLEQGLAETIAWYEGYRLIEQRRTSLPTLGLPRDYFADRPNDGVISVVGPPGTKDLLL
ncbi:MAG: GDP-L-fucose synthase [Planctomycetota bacterium]|nr:GDP-L-fucose synthase [Planctomycetota bacterium]